MNYTDIIIAFVAGAFSIFVLLPNKKGEFVTTDRENWRVFLIQWIKDTTLTINKVNSSNLKYVEKKQFIHLLESQKN